LTGSGKSTLQKMLDGLIFPSSGVIKAFVKTLTENILDGDGRDFLIMLLFLVKTIE
jgi:ABC-type antimicrobial peptide transport system ATPase subunit